MTSIYSATSSVDVLRSLLVSSRGRPVSIRKLSKDLGYSSDRTIGMILKGQRPMTDELATKVGQRLALTSTEKQFLALLVLRDRAIARKKEHAAFDSELNKLRPKKIKNLKIDDQQFACLTDWYSLTVLELVCRAPKGVTAVKVTERLRGKVSLSEVTGTLENLSILGFVVKAGESYRKNMKFDFIRTFSDIPSQAIRKSHANQLVRAAATLDEQSVLDRQFIAKTFAMSPAKIVDAKKRLAELLETFASEFCDQAANFSDEVYQLNLQFYLQTK